MTLAMSLPRVPSAAIWLVTSLMLLTMRACAPGHALSLKVNTAHVAGPRYAPEELGRMMTDLGYQQLRVEDPVTQQSVVVAEQYGEYRLLFHSLENNNIRVDIHADMADGRIVLYVYDINQGTLGNSELQLYEQLEQRVRFEYGAEHVRTSRP
jgi:hypothetical protein